MGRRSEEKRAGVGGCWVWKMLLNSASPVASRTAAVSIVHTAARPKKREVKPLSSVIKMPLILACAPEAAAAAAEEEEEENTSAQKVLTSKHRFCFFLSLRTCVNPCSG